MIACTHLGLSPVARVLARRSRRPYAVFIHGVEAWRPLPLRSRWGLRGAAQLYFNSDYTRERFYQFNPWARTIAAVLIPLGLTSHTLYEPETAVASAADAEPHKAREVRTGPFQILAVGRMARAELQDGHREALDLYKGFKPLIEAVGMLATSGPVHLKIVGDGDARPDLEAWLASRPERAHVSFLGRVDDAALHRLYEETDVFALPSECEGFGLVYVEAMAHGLPCVAVAAGAAPEVVRDGATGLIARPRDVNDLAAKLERLRQEPSLRMSLGAEALRVYEAQYTAEAFERRIVEALQSLAKNA